MPYAFRFAFSLFAVLIFGAATTPRATAQDRGWVGLRAETLTPETVMRRKLAVPFGVIVTTVHPSGPAEASGVNVGDVIISIDGVPVQNLAGMRGLLEAKRAGTKITVGAVKAGQITTVDITLSQRPARVGGQQTAQIAKPQLMLETGGHMAIIWMMEFTRDGKYLVTASSDKVIRIWDWESGKTVRRIRGEAGPGALGKPYAIALSPDNKWLMVGGWTHKECVGRCGSIRVYDFETGEIAGLLEGHTNILHALEFSEDGRYLVSGSADNSARVWDTTTWEQVSHLRGHTQNIYQSYFLDGGRRVVTGSYDGQIKVWDTVSGKLLATLRKHRSQIRSMAVSSDGTMMASGSNDGFLYIWDTATLQPIGKPITLPAAVGALTFVQGGSRIVATTGIGRGGFKQRVFDVASREQLLSYDAHRNTTFSTIVHPDGRTVATGDFLGEVHVWDTETGIARSVLAGAGRSLWATAVSRDSKWIAWGITPSYKTNTERGPLQYMLRLPGADGKLGRPQRFDQLRAKEFARARLNSEGMAIRHVRGGLDGLIEYDGALEIKVGGKVVKTYHRGKTDGFRHRSYAVSQDGERIVTGGNNGIILAIGRDGNLIGRYRGHNSEVWVPHAITR